MRGALSSADKRDDFDHIAFSELMLFMLLAWHQLFVDFYRHGLVLEPKLHDKIAHRLPRWNLHALTVDENVDHDRMLANRRR